MAAQALPNRSQDGDETGSLAALIDLIPDGVFVVDADHRIRCCNALVERMFGYRAGELEGCPIGLLLPDLGDPDPALLQVARDTWLAESGRRKGGGTFALEMTGGDIVWNGQTVSLRIVRD